MSMPPDHLLDRHDRLAGELAELMAKVKEAAAYSAPEIAAWRRELDRLHQQLHDNYEAMFAND